MKVQIREGGDGVACWNAEAVVAYAAQVDAREAAIGAANPDMAVTPATISCYGCEVLDYDMGVRCTAGLTRTIYAVPGEVAPRSEDAEASLSLIPGLLTRLDAVPSTSVPGAAPQAPPAPEPAPTRATDPVRAATARTGLRSLFGRRP